MLRLTKTVRDALLTLNEGFQKTTHYSGKNFSETRTYRIIEGALHVRESGKTSWADSRYARDRLANADEVHRFLKKNLDALKKDGLG